DCCVNSCCCFVGPNSSLDKCPHCNTSRYLEGQQRKHFIYIPLIPRLVGFFKNPNLVYKMSY
ncbi:hypothetical protein SERLA73DRAFT_42604, partial [Serpula lacrymans var. lacrymans S7.3]